MAMQATSGRGPSGAARMILYGGLVVGTLDILDAIAFWGLSKGVAPIRIFQSVAAGLLGRSSMQGGLPTALLGALLHFFIACSIVSVYYLASQRFAALTHRPVICGLAYGFLVFCFMTFVVVPLSAANNPKLSPPVLANGLLGHALLIGLPSALFARAAARRS